MHDVNLRGQIYMLFICLVYPASVAGQTSDLAAIYPRMNEIVSQLLFENGAPGFNMKDAYRARSEDLAENHPRLAVSGDFTGDGLDEYALFEDLLYNPNLNPEFTCSVVRISRSSGDQFIPAGTWFSVLDTGFYFDYVNFSVAGDYNQDGFSDIALFYNDPGSEQLTLYVLESDGRAFSEAIPWYTCERNDFNFTALKFACGGDFNGNGKPDIAVFYNYNGSAPETRQSVFLFESDGDIFELLPAVYDASKAEYDFSDMKFAMSGDFNMDTYSDLAVWMNDPTGMQTQGPLFVGSASGQLSTDIYYNAPVSELDLDDIVQASSGEFAGDAASDLAVFYDNPGSGSQEILVLESKLTSFASPEIGFITDPGNLAVSDITSVVSGNFAHQAMVRAATWKEDRQGAISFTFDDGYKGAFEHGGSELDAEGLSGSFYIFTDTSLTYDGEIAGTSLVREYKEKGHEIASHTSNHSDLGLLSGTGENDSLSTVLSESVKLLNERFDQETFSIAIPFGSFRYETLDSISNHFYTARSSQFGFNLATPYDFFALKSWPVLSTTTPAFVDTLVAIAESFGHYLPLMYHDMTDEAFDEDAEIYTYSRDKFRETVQLAGNRSVWIDTHQNIYKYIRMRNALKIDQLELGEAELQPGHFSFVADDGLVDSIFNVELSLLIRLPESWTEDSATVESGDQHIIKEVLSDEKGDYLLYNCLPSSARTIHVYEGKKPATRVHDFKVINRKVSMEAYPNPFILGTRIIVSTQGTAQRKLVLLDLQGRMLREIQLNQNGSYYLSREALSHGIYVLQLMESGVQIASLRLMAR
jgi:peptidoglycan/xylan/chitin deacetylase (PgdA/CDA1 family)